MRTIYARGNLTTTLTTKGVHSGGQYCFWRTDYCTGLLSVETGGRLSSGLSRR